MFTKFEHDDHWETPYYDYLKATLGIIVRSPNFDKIP